MSLRSHHCHSHESMEKRAYTARFILDLLLWMERSYGSISTEKEVDGPFFEIDSPGILWDFCRRGMKWIFQQKRTSVEHKKQWMQCSSWEDRSAFFLYIFWPLKCVLLLKDKWFWINKCCFLLEKFYYWKILCKTIQTLFAIFNPTVWFLSQQPWKECCTRFNW